MTTIVVGVDGSAGARRALTWAYEQARRAPGTRIRAISTWLPSVPIASPWFAGYDIPNDLTEMVQAELDAAVRDVIAGGEGADVEIERRVVCGSAVAVLMDEAGKADALVVGARGRGGFKGLLMGSVSHQLITHASGPTIVVPAPSSRLATEAADPLRIVVGVDGSPNSIAALRWARNWAAATAAHVRAINAWQLPLYPASRRGAAPVHEDPKAVAVRELASWIADAGLAGDPLVEAHTRQGLPAAMLIDEATRAGMLVVGARGHGGFTGLLLGSVAMDVAPHSPCPVAVVRD